MNANEKSFNLPVETDDNSAVEEAGKTPYPETSSQAASAPPPSVKLVQAQPTEPHQEHHNTLFRLQVADQIWCYIAHGIVMTDAEGLVQSVNPAFISLLGYTVEQEVLNRDIRSFLTDSTDLDGMLRRLRDCCVCVKRVAFNTHDSRVLPVQVTASPVIKPGGSVSNFVFSMEDASAVLEADSLRLQAEQEAQKTALAKERLSTIVEIGYALNDPLQTLLGLAEEEGRKDYQEQIIRIIDLIRETHKTESAKQTETGALIELQAALPEKYTQNRDPSLEPCDTGKILLVDDDPMIRELFKRIISTAFPDLTVDLAKNGTEALEFFEAKHHSIVIIDLMMPQITGEEVFSQIVEVCSGKQWALPHCVFFTGFMPSLLVTTITQDPHHVLLRKPIRRNVIIDVITNFLKLEVQGKINEP